MLISHRKKFIYTKTVKTAGTSVEVFFERYCVPEGPYTPTHATPVKISEAGIIGLRGSRKNEVVPPEWYNHMGAAAIKNKLSSHIWDNYFKFCVIRNPFDRLISLFWFNNRKQGEKTFDHLSADTIIGLFRKWLLTSKINTSRSMYLIDNEVCMDFFIRYEHLQKDIEKVCTILKIDYQEDQLPFLKKSSRVAIPIASYYDQACIDVVEQIHGFELDYFNYTLPNQ